VLGTAKLLRPATFFVLHSLSASPTEIPERFSSSLLPPSFAAGRCAAIFLPKPAARRGRLHPFALRTAVGARRPDA